MSGSALDVSIRRIEAGDAESYRACFDEVARERRFLAHLEAPSLDVVRAFVEHSAAHDALVLVALDAGAVVGWCDILAQPHEGMRHTGVLDMGVRPAYRRRGLGRRLAQTCIARARAAGIARIELEAWASNAPALALYTSLGFVREGVKRRARSLDGVVEDCICMAWLTP